MKRLKDDKGFTLMEMLIVLAIISILILIAIPNVTKHSKSIDEKGCEAYVQMIQSQVEAYKMEHKLYPETLEALEENDYISEEPMCPDGSQLTIEDGKVVLE